MPIGLFFLLGRNPTYISAKNDYEDRKKCEKCMKYIYRNSKIDDSEFYKINKSEPYWKSEYKAMIFGKRIRADDILALEQRATKNFVLPGTDKLYKIRDLTLNNLRVDGLPNEILNRLSPLNNIVIIGESRFEQVIYKYFEKNEIAPYLNIIKKRSKT